MPHKAGWSNVIATRYRSGPAPPSDGPSVTSWGSPAYASTPFQISQIRP